MDRFILSAACLKVDMQQLSLAADLTLPDLFLNTSSSLSPSKDIQSSHVKSGVFFCRSLRLMEGQVCVALHYIHEMSSCYS